MSNQVNHQLVNGHSNIYSQITRQYSSKHIQSKHQIAFQFCQQQIINHKSCYQHFEINVLHILILTFFQLFLNGSWNQQNNISITWFFKGLTVLNELHIYMFNYLQLFFNKFIDEIQDDNQNTQLAQEELEELKEWNFNILKFDKLHDKFRFTFGMFVDTNLFDFLNCSQNTFFNFLTTLSDKYDHRNNPFHNFNHGITVAHGIYYIIKQGITDRHLNKVEQFTLLFSALCHDVDHTGRSNAYENVIKSDLFELYGNESPLEKHHTAVAIQVADRCNIFANVTKEQEEIIKKYVKCNILATDMSKHNQIMKEFKENLPIFLDQNNVINEAQKINLCGALVHASDIGAPTRDFTISREWSMRIAKEFISQLELEKQNNIPLTPFYIGLDKYLKLATNEIGFINFFIKPFWLEIQQYGQGKLQQVEVNIDKNIECWTQEKQQEEKRIQETELQNNLQEVC